MGERAKADTGHGWAWTGVIIGAGLSVAGNAWHVALTDSTMGLALRLVWAVIWPVLLLVGIEVLVRVPWRNGWRRYWLDQLGRILLVGPVAAVAAVVSYRHQSALILLADPSDPFSATIGPLAIDGLMLGCTVAILIIRTIADLGERAGREQEQAAEIEAIQRQGEVAWRMSEQERVERGQFTGTSGHWPENVSDLIEEWDRADMSGAAAPGSPAVIPGYEQSDEQDERSDEQGDERASKRRATPEALHAAALELMNTESAWSSVEEIARAHGVGVSTLRRYEKVRRLLIERGRERLIDCATEKVRPDVVEAMRSYLRNEHGERGERHEAGE